MVNCQDRVYGEEMVSDFAFCNLWQRRFDRWPCSSPRRNQCRTGLMAHDYSVKSEWRMRQSKRFDAMWTDCCQLPF